MDSRKKSRYISVALIFSLALILIFMCIDIEVKMQGLLKSEPVVIYSLIDESTTAESLVSQTETYPYTFNQAKSFDYSDAVTTAEAYSTKQAESFNYTTSYTTTEASAATMYQPTTSAATAVNTTGYAEVHTDSYQQYTSAPVLTSPVTEIVTAAQPDIITDAYTVTSFASAPEAHNISSTYYVTNTGTKYHLSDCSYLKKSKIPITYDEIIAGGYEPCSRCFK